MLSKATLGKRCKVCMYYLLYDTNIFKMGIFKRAQYNCTIQLHNTIVWQWSKVLNFFLRFGNAAFKLMEWAIHSLPEELQHKWDKVIDVNDCCVIGSNRFRKITIINKSNQLSGLERSMNSFGFVMFMIKNVLWIE